MKECEKMRDVFIINPFSGKGKRQKPLIEELEKRGITYYLTKCSMHASKLAKSEAEKGDEVRIFSCGGEGTNFEVLNGIVGYDNATMGIVPCGTANDFIKFFGDEQPFLDIDDQLCGDSYFVDLIKAGDMYGINSCSAGMDAMVCENTIKFKKLPFVSGSGAYVLGVVNAFFQHFGEKMNFVIDGKPFDGIPSLFAVCANAPYYGGGYKCAPLSNPSDGKLDYSIIATKSKIKAVLTLGKYRKGEHIKLKNCYFGNCTTMEYHADKPIPFNIDGEIYRFRDITCEIVKAAQKLSLPKKVSEKFKDVLTPVVYSAKA